MARSTVASSAGARADPQPRGAQQLTRHLARDHVANLALVQGVHGAIAERVPVHHLALGVQDDASDEAQHRAGEHQQDARGSAC